MPFATSGYHRLHTGHDIYSKFVWATFDHRFFFWSSTNHTRVLPEISTRMIPPLHDDVIKWKHFLRYWPFVRRIQFPHKGQWRGALMFTLICARLNEWVNTRKAGDLRRHRAHHDVIVMYFLCVTKPHAIIWWYFTAKLFWKLVLLIAVWKHAWAVEANVTIEW